MTARRSRWMRPGHWLLRDETPRPEEVALTAWMAEAPAPVTMLLHLLLPPRYPDTPKDAEARRERARRVRHAGYVWHNIVSAEPEVRAWGETNLIAWLDRMPQFEDAERDV